MFKRYRVIRTHAVNSRGYYSVFFLVQKRKLFHWKTLRQFDETQQESALKTLDALINRPKDSVIKEA